MAGARSIHPVGDPPPFATSALVKLVTSYQALLGVFLHGCACEGRRQAFVGLVAYSDSEVPQSIVRVCVGVGLLCMVAHRGWTRSPACLSRVCSRCGASRDETLRAALFTEDASVDHPDLAMIPRVPARDVREHSHGEQFIVLDIVCHVPEVNSPHQVETTTKIGKHFLPKLKSRVLDLRESASADSCLSRPSYNSWPRPIPNC